MKLSVLDGIIISFVWVVVIAIMHFAFHNFLVVKVPLFLLFLTLSCAILGYMEKDKI